MAYSDAFKTEVIIRLAVNKYNYQKTADQIGIPVRTIRNWEKKFPKKGVGELLDRAIERMLLVIPDTWTGTDWAIALGILIDKWLLMQGQPTSRTETIFTALEQMPDDELDEIIRQFEAAASGSDVADSRTSKA